MSTHRPNNPVTLNTSVNTHRDSARSARPLTYTSNATAAPTYSPNEQSTISAHNRSESVRAWSASLPSINLFRSTMSLNTDCGSTRSILPPTYTTNITPAPTYASDVRSAASADHSILSWAAGLPSPPSALSLGTASLSDESSLMDTVSIGTSPDVRVSSCSIYGMCHLRLPYFPYS
jgi:hypothetical protein